MEKFKKETKQLIKSFLKLWPVWLFFIFLFFVFVIESMPRLYDDTDNAQEGERSGLKVYTDNLTGCQYLKAGLFGGMTPRRNKANEHVGCK